jgi:predicted nucleic acid-binding protein
MIALCCRRVGATLVTQNSKDFRIISAIKPIRFEVWE